MHVFPMVLWVLRGKLTSNSKFSIHVAHQVLLSTTMDGQTFEDAAPIDIRNTYMTLCARRSCELNAILEVH